MLAFGEAPNSVVHLHILLAGVQTGPLAVLADFVDVATVGLYGIGVRRLGRRGRRWPKWNSIVFALGMIAIWAAVGSGLAAYDDVNVTMHVLQHVLLMMVAPPLIALGKPLTLASQASSRPNQVRILKVVHSHAMAVLTYPVLTSFLYYGTMYAFFLSSVYPYSVTHPLFHDATHLEFLVVGYLYWQPVVGLDPARWRFSYPARIGSLFIGMPFEAFLGISIMMSTQPLAPINTLSDTHNAGEALWILSMVTSGLCTAALVGQWFCQMQRQTPREDRRAEAETEAAKARAEALGVENLRSGWTIPWWRLAELEAQQARNLANPPNRRGGQPPSE